MPYDDSPTPANLGRSPQGQRCPSCGHVEPDRWARFCGVCGGTLGQGQGQGGAPAHGQGGPPPAATREPPVRYGTVAPSGQPQGPAPAPYMPNAGPQAAAPGYPQSIQYTVPSVGFGAPARIGAAVAAGFTLLPCVLFAFLGAWLVHEGRVLLDSWQTASVKVPVPLVSVDLSMNFIDLLRMRKIFDVFIYWDDRLWLTFAIIWLVPWILWIIAGAFFGILLALIYNIIGKMGGGISMTMVPAARQPGQPMHQPVAWTPGEPPPWSGAPQQRR